MFGAEGTVPSGWAGEIKKTVRPKCLAGKTAIGKSMMMLTTIIWFKSDLYGSEKATANTNVVILKSDAAIH